MARRRRVTQGAFHRCGCFERTDDQQRSFEPAGYCEALVGLCARTLEIAGLDRRDGEKPQEIRDEPLVTDRPADFESLFACVADGREVALPARSQRDREEPHAYALVVTRVASDRQRL